MPVRTLFEYPAANDSLEDFLEPFPSVSCDVATQFSKDDCDKDREALFGNETVNSLFDQALAQQPK